MTLGIVEMAPVVQVKRVLCYTRIGGLYPILCGLYGLNALTSASGALDGHVLEEEAHGGRTARASAERDEPLPSADLPQLRPRARFLPSSRKLEGRAPPPAQLDI